MMVIAAIVPVFLMGIAAGAGILGMFMLVCGFFRLPNDLPDPVWRYPFYYLSFHTYAFEGFMTNEFTGLTFENRPASLPRLSGWVCSTLLSKPGWIPD
jgi:ABC-type multidrug transport system permease subunit